MTPGILLDTCAILWVAQSSPLDPSAESALTELWQAGGTVHVSPISAWELGLLVSRGGLAMSTAPEKWWAAFMARSGTELAPMPPEILIAASGLPGGPPSDPVDRILVATAREYGLRLMTRDNRLLDYGLAGHLQTIVC